MNKALFFACMLTCYAQATVVADLIALKNEFTQMLPSKTQETVAHPPIAIKRDEYHPITSASCEFAKGFFKGMSVYALVAFYKSFFSESTNSDCLMNDDGYLTKCAILASGFPACAEDVMQSLNVIFSGLKKDGCNHCAQRVSRQDVLNSLARIGGSVSAMSVLYWAACAVGD